jgi:hypothetical protein
MHAAHEHALPAPPAAGRMQSRILAAQDITAALREDMFALYAAHYEACTPQRFARDLAGKNHVIVLESGGRLLGFSTAAHYGFQSSRGPVQVLFSGDTVIDRSAWGEQALSRSFARLGGALLARESGTPLYWLLISKGHRTYRYLSIFARDFFPRAGGGDAGLAQLAQEIAGARFGADYDAGAGVITFDESQGHLKDDLAEVPQHIAARPEGAFFLARNPGYRRGHELVCLTQLTPANLRSVVRESFLSGMAHGLG